MKYLIYTRVSERGSDWRGDTSCEAQADECRRYVLARDPSATFQVETDEFRSGTNADRPGYQRILDGIETAAWDCLVSLDMDRLARSQKVWVEIADRLAKSGKGLICVRQNADFSTIQGRMMLGLFSVLGEFYAKSGAQKTRDKMLHMARQGLWPCGMAPYGYKRGEVGDNVLQPDPDTAPVVRRFFADYAAGKSLVEIGRDTGIMANKLARMIRNPIYTGKIIYGGITADGKHEAIVKQHIFDAANARLPGTRTAPRRARQVYPYTLAGKVRCACGKTMSASFARNRYGKCYPYYRCNDVLCTVKKRQVRADQLENAVAKEIQDATENDALISDNFKRLVEMRATMASQNDGELARWRDELADLERRAVNMAASLQAASIGASAMRHLSAVADALYVKIDELAGRIKAREAEIAEYSAPDTLAQLETAWRQMARELAKPKAPPDARRKWMDLHIKEVKVDGDNWRVVFYVPESSRETRAGCQMMYLCELYFLRRQIA